LSRSALSRNIDFLESALKRKILDVKISYQNGGGIKNMSQDISDACMSKVKEILTSDESVLFSVAQMSIAGLKPDNVVLTNKRFILYHPGLLGCNLMISFGVI